MSINVSSSILRNCVSESLTAQIDFNKYTGARRTNLISALRGVKKMTDPTVTYIRNSFGLPYIGPNAWRGITPDSGFWDRLEQAIALTQLEGVEKIVIAHRIDSYARLNWFDRIYSDKVRDAKSALVTRPKEGYIDSWYFPCLSTKPIQTWMEPVSPDNKVWDLIEQLERGENPEFWITFGAPNEYITPNKRGK